MVRRLLLAVALPVLIGAAAHAQSGPVFSPERFRSHVAFLADDLLEGREAGSRGYDIAAAYLASEFDGLGLTPGGQQGSWFQKVPLRSAELADEPARVTISGPSGTKSWTNKTDVLLGPSLAERQQDITASVVFVGYGIDSPKHGLADYSELDVKGKIVAVLAGAPANVPSELAAYFNDRKAAMAAQHGAIGLISLPTAQSEKAASWQDRVRRATGPSMTSLDPQGQPFDDDTPGIRFIARFNTPAAEALFAGAPSDYAALRAQAERADARPKGFPLNVTVRVQRTSTWTDAPSANVIGVLPGSDPGLRNQYVILTAHLDHIGIKRDAAAGADRINNGALDNAAGIATMLEAAQAFAQSRERPKRPILFIGLTGEEKGLLGSESFAHHPTVPLDSIAGVVNLDMPLLLYDFTDVVAFGAERSTLAVAVERAARAMGVRLSPDPMPEQNIFVRSDHYEFVKRGVPAIMLATGFANGGAAKWDFFFKTSYHYVGDDIRQPIHWQAGARFARLNYLIARELANAEERPRWYRGDFFGETYAPQAPKAPPLKRQ